MYAIVFHAHQKLDRVAYRHLEHLLGGDSPLPPIKNILHFEGVNGPDATKLKNKENVEQPWHFMNPLDDSDRQLSKVVADHYENLVAALRENNTSRTAFEAAWIAHAIVDGLTPAHHYPYEAELEDLRGSDRNTRKGIIGRAMVKGETAPDSIVKSLKLVGPKGLLTTHTLFEAGAYSIIAPLRLQNGRPTDEEIKTVGKNGIIQYFETLAKEVAGFEMYTKFYETGWTPVLARTVRRELAPRMVKAITLAWHQAIKDAQAA